MYLLDTNILSDLIKKKPNPKLLQRLQAQPPESLCTTIISVMELRAGSMRSEDKNAFWKRIEEEILSRIKIIKGLTD